MTANTSPSHQFSAKHYLLKDPVALAKQWQQVEQDAEASFFLSWQWIGTWVAVYPLDLIVLEVLNSEQRLVGLALLHPRDIKRHSVVSSKALYLQQSGLASLDQIWIEYNGLLVNQQYQQQITATALAYIARELQWDEFMLGGINRDTAEVYASQLALNSHQLWQAPCYGVDLQKIRASAGNYLATLSANTRYQINRAIKKFDALGGVTLVRANNTAQAQAYFEQIGPLHIKRWGAGPFPSGFLNPDFVQFHQQLIQRNWPNGIDVFKLALAEQTIAIYYNFLYKGTVYFYLGGINFELDKQLKPGLVAHALLIDYYLQQGWQFYDFMAGNERYKAQLGTVHQELVQVALQRPKLKFYIERHMRKLKHQVINLAARHRNKVSSGEETTK